jgi:hypothetical protein
MKNKLNNYYKELPEGFIEDYTIDAKKRSTAISLNLVGFVLAVVVILICYVIKFDTYPSTDGLNGFEVPLVLLVFAVSVVIYMVLHELTHGLVYKLLTKQKLTFGFTVSCAYCGLKQGFVNKKTAIIAMLAPFVIHGIWMLLLIALLPANIWVAMLVILFGSHFGGCIGDLYDAIILIVKYHNKQVLLSDIGPKQIFYVRNE